MPELWRKRKNGKPTGSWLITIDKQRINLLTKDANVARQRAAMIPAGFWPPPKGLTPVEADDAYAQQLAADSAASVLEATDPTRGGTMENGSHTGGEPAAPNTPAVAGSSPAPPAAPNTSEGTKAPAPPAPTAGEPPAARALPPIGASSAVHPDEVIPPPRPATLADDAAAAAAEATGSEPSSGAASPPAAGSGLDELLRGLGMSREDLSSLLGAAHSVLCSKLASLVNADAEPSDSSDDVSKAIQKFAGPAALACIEKRLASDVQLSPEWMLFGATLAGVGGRVLLAVPREGATPPHKPTVQNGSDGRPTNIDPPTPPVPPDFLSGLNLSPS